MWNNNDEAMQEFRYNYEELAQIINRKEKQIQFLETKALNMSMFYVASQLALFLCSNSELQSCRHSRKPLLISLSVAVAFGLNFATTIRNYVRTKYEQERNYMDQEENFHQMVRLERSVAKNGVVEIDTQEHEVRPDARGVYQRYAHLGLTVAALLAITALVLHACTTSVCAP